MKIVLFQSLKYFCENHLAVQISFIADGIQSESDSPENPVKEPLFDEKEKQLF